MSNSATAPSGSTPPRGSRTVIVVAATALVTVVAVALWWWTRVTPRDTTAPSVDHVVAPTPPHSEETPAPERRVRGRVLGPDGAVIEGADVALFRLQGNETVLPRPVSGEVSLSQADGRFEFAVSPVRDLAVGARMPGLVSSLVPVGDGRRELILRLANAYDVRGYVSDHFAPVAGCEVVLESDDDRFFSHVTKTGTDGAFRFVGIYPGLVSLSARTPLYRPAVQLGIVVGALEPRRLPVGGVALSLRGRVWLDGPEPLPADGARVCATPQRDERVRLYAVPYVTQAGEDGRFELAGLGPGTHRVEISHPLRSTVIRTVEVDSPAANEVDVRLPARAAVRGGLLGAELVSVELLLVTDQRERARARTDTGGRFEFVGTHSTGAASLVLLDRSLCFERTWSRRISIEIDGEALSLAVAPAMLLVGDVMDSVGKPIAGVEVFVDSERMPGIDVLRAPAASTDAEGRYRVHVARNVATQLTFAHPAFATAAVQLPRQASGVQQPLTLHPPSRISGVVMRDGKPLPAAIVYLPADGGTRAWATTGPDGAFTLHGVPPGEHRLIVRYGTVTEVSAQATVLPGRDVERALLTLPAGRLLEGRVLDELGQGVAAALVAVDAGGGVVTDVNGRFTLDAPRGEVELHAFAPAWHLGASRTVGADANAVTLVLPIPPHGRLRARLQSVPGRRPDGALLAVQPLDTPASTLDAGSPLRWVDVRDGVLAFDRVPAGRWRVSVRCAGHVPLEVEGSVKAGAEWDLGTCVLEPGATLRGCVLDEGGKPVPGAQVMLGTESDLFVVIEAARARGNDLFSVRADLRGRFELSGVSSRQKTLVVQAAGYASQEETLRIPADLLRQDPLQVTLRVGVDFMVQVIDARGEPLRGRAVEVRKQGFSVDVGRSDADGRCVFRHRAMGEYRVCVPGTSAGEIVDVQQEQQTYHVVLRIEDR